MLFKGKVAIVTGGANGIGLACIEEMLKNNILGVTMVDIDERSGIAAMNDLNGKYGKGKVIFVKANVANKIEVEGAFKKTIDTFKQFDILFNNAGIFDEADYENCIAVNLVGYIHALKLAIDEYLPKYKSGKDALIINTSSCAGLTPFLGVEIYSTTKFGVVGLTRNFGSDHHYQRTGVKVMAICPTATVTAIIEKGLKSIIYEEKKQEFLDSANRKQQTPEELAKCFARIVEIEDNGSVWLIQEGKETKMDFPELFQL